MLKIIPLQAFKDNYIWLIVDEAARKVIVIDPGDAAPVIDCLNKNNWRLTAILITHKHHDHCGGVAELKDKYHPQIIAPKSEHIPWTTQICQEGSDIHLSGFSFTIKVLAIPGHTLEHVAYYIPQLSALFCGDTLFTGGCGRVFEGTAEQMVHSLKKLTSLPADTLIYCGHEYTENNLKFALIVEPDNPQLQQRFAKVTGLRKINQPTVPEKLSIELQTNPFLRCRQPKINELASAYMKKPLADDEIAVFSAIRTWKNNL